MLLEVVSAKYCKDYQVDVEFNNGCKYLIDLKDHIFNDHRKIFYPLRDTNFFKNFSLKYNTLCWKNEADFAPEFLLSVAQKARNEGNGANFEL